MAATTHDEAESALRATRTSFRHSANARYERLWKYYDSALGRWNPCSDGHFSRL